jgi:valyl-tRNA synthetase
MSANEAELNQAKLEDNNNIENKNNVEEEPKKDKINPKKLAKLAKFQAKQENPKNNFTKAKEKSVPKSYQTKDFVNKTPKGEKKKVTFAEMETSYNPRAVESAWYDWWEAQGYFKPSLDKNKKKFVIPIPPPNVTGSLHLGHALTNSIQDCLIRWRRMKGFNTLYVPGCDHAGIATQAVVEKMLAKKGISKHQIGREKFLEHAWEWKNTKGDRIYNQLKRMGSSYDWSRVCFTLDPKFVTAVNEAFITLHTEGLIYRDTRLVNWSCKLNTALSNLEVDTKELEKKTKIAVPGHNGKSYDFGVLSYFSYQIDGGSPDDKITVATTRLETMLGDTAVAVNPKDTRYAKHIGKFLIHPFNGRKLPIIGDEMVDMEFGTGCVKITPAHDPNDYVVGKRHKLDFINILNDDGSINSNGAPFEGMMRFDARVEVMKKLKSLGLFEKSEDHKMNIPICSRSGDIIEPMLKPQWYVNCKDMAKEAADAVRNGELTITPLSSQKEWFSWLDNIQDWCISRQLWWGHSIPAYFVVISGEENDRSDGKYWVSGETKEIAMEKAIKKFGPNITLEQDQDVLDTWFSAALWPFGVMGWPNKTQDYDLFYPNSLLETGWDILFFWVARMVMMGKKLTGKIPFSEVYCHAMVRDAHGRKMSKSLGNVIDPQDVIEGISLEDLGKQLENGNLDSKELQKAKEGQRKDYPNGIPECGVDALRFALCAYSTDSSRDISLDILRVEGYRKFCNKIWNATRYVLGALGSEFQPESRIMPGNGIHERWILHRLNICIGDVDKSLGSYHFKNATEAIYKFIKDELCDVYIEAVKTRNDPSSLQTLYSCLQTGLVLLHPFMPFVTEELYQILPKRKDSSAASIMIAEYPEENSVFNAPEVEKSFEKILGVVKAIRSLSTDHGIKSGTVSYALATSKPVFDLLASEKDIIKTLVYQKEFSFEVVENESKIPPGCALQIVNNECKVYILLGSKGDTPDGQFSRVTIS